MKKTVDIDYLVIGGGFYGCCLALFLRSLTKNITLVEKEDELLSRASKVNQARVHTGFHYPRSAVTAVKSMILHKRFSMDFPQAIDDSFQMLYAIARRNSKVSSKRFYRMFSNIGAPIAIANSTHKYLFNPEIIEDVFACTEYAFNYSTLRNHLRNRIDALDINLELQTKVIKLEDNKDAVIAHLSNGREVRAKYAFNVTYSKINRILRNAKLPEARLKYELTEIALVTPPKQILGYGITVMDGPFFSIMPFPTEKLYSFTHVRYTPHKSWTDTNEIMCADDAIRNQSIESKYRHMILDSQRYVPCLSETEWQRSIYEIKTILLKNEIDDGRPILFQREPTGSRIISIMGGKIDNIYDLFDLIKATVGDLADADDRHVYCRPR